MRLDIIKSLYSEILLDVMKFQNILLSFIKYHKISSGTGKDLKILLILAKLSAIFCLLNTVQYHLILERKWKILLKFG